MSFHRWRVIVLKVLVLMLAVLSGGVSATAAAPAAQSSAQPSTQPSIPSSTPSATHKSATTTKKKSSATTVTHPRRKTTSPRLQRMHEAFVSSAAFETDGEAIASGSFAGGLRGRGRVCAASCERRCRGVGLAGDRLCAHSGRGYAQAIDPLNQARPRAGDLGDYVNFYLGTAYYQTGRLAEAVATLGGFAKAYPESLLIRDVHVTYANALVATGVRRKRRSCWRMIVSQFALTLSSLWGARTKRRASSKGAAHLSESVFHDAARGKRPRSTVI